MALELRQQLKLSQQLVTLFNPPQPTKINLIRRRQRDEKDSRLFNADK